jgi:WD40 repeat protein
MNLRSVGLGPLVALFLVSASRAEGPLPPLGDRDPILCLEAGGPRAGVMALAFGPEGKLYEGGFDKVVRVWAEEGGRFVLKDAYRVPIGPGESGIINALAVSSDGRWLAVGGIGAVRQTTGFRQSGWIVSKSVFMNEDMQQDEGTVYLFDTRARSVQALRGHHGAVTALAFAPDEEGQAPLLVSGGVDWVKADQPVGALWLWQAGKGDQWAAKTSIRIDDVSKPNERLLGLAAWRVGQTARVALAWQDGNLRVWDTGAQKLTSLPDGALNNTVVFLPDQAAVLTASLHNQEKQHGHLQRWQTDDKKGLVEDRTWTVELDLCAPQALALLPTGPNGRYDHAALVSHYSSHEYYLDLVSLRPGPGLGPVKNQVKLWNDGENVPLLAVDRQGRFLAVPGKSRQEIRVFSIAKLLQGEKQEFATLRSEGMNWSEVEFRRNGEAQGLFLKPVTPGLQGQSMILDFNKHRLTDELQGWKTDQPSLQGWKVQWADDKNIVCQVTTPDGKSVAVPLEKLHKGDCTALLPPGVLPGLDAPLLAVASRAGGVAYLGLYDARSGHFLRQLTDHVNRIRSLAFSGDGRFLASAADDQTVCVWSLTDLIAARGRHGLLRGLTVEPVGADLRVTWAEGGLDAANRARLQAVEAVQGDVLEGLVDDSGLQRMKSAKAFYDAIWARKPGDNVKLRLRGREDVPLLVGESIDERKPLFSLFVTNEAKVRDRVWLCWSPYGPYDASDPDQADRYIGWHINTGKPDAPITFSPADQHRKDYLREGLLAFLIKEGDLVPALHDYDRAKAPKPTMSLYVPEAFPTATPVDRDGNEIVQHPRGLLRARVDDLPLDKVAWVKWQRDDGDLKDFPRHSEGTYEADLDLSPDRKKVHTFHLVVCTVEDLPFTYHKTIKIRYLPPPPKVALEEPPEVQNKDFTLKGTIQPGMEGPQAPQLKVSLRLNGAKRPETTLPVQLELRPGENEVLVTAENEGLLSELKELETTTRRLVINLKDTAKQLPSITLDPIGTYTVTSDDQEIIVHDRSLFVSGRITAQEPLTEAIVRSASEPKGRQLKGFDPAKKTKLFEFKENVTLLPGKQTLSFEARTTAAGPPKKLLVNYQPDLPVFALAAPANLERSASDPLKVTLEVRLSKLDYPYRYSAKVLFKQQVLEERVSTGAKEEVIKKEIELQPGDNMVEVEVRNDTWARPIQKYRIYSPRLPELVNATQPPVPNKPRVDVTATFKTSSDLPLTGGRVRGEGTGDRDLTPKDYAQKPNGDWEVTARDVVLKEGVNTIQLWARNRDGETLKPAEFRLSFTSPDKPPTIAVRDPRQDVPLDPGQTLSVSTPHQVFQIQVRSHSPISQLELLSGQGRKDLTSDVVVKQEEGARVFILDKTVPLELNTGRNELRVVVVNASGPSSLAWTMFCKPPSPFVHLESIEERAPPGTILLPDHRDHDRPVFDRPAGSAQLWLHGYVQWPDKNDPLIKDPDLRVRVWVNDAEQEEGRLLADDGQSRRSFKVGVLLTQEKHNRVQLAFPGLALEANPEFFLDCRVKPELDQRLHLLVVAPERSNPESLTESLLTALQAERSADGTLRAKAFKKGLTIRTAPRDCTRERVYSLLLEIKDMNATLGAANDVVLVYFQGREKMTDDDLLLLTGLSREDDPLLKERAIECKKLRKILSEVRGAKVLLLDAQGKQGVQSEAVFERGWQASAPHVGTLSYLWLGDQAPPDDERLLAVLKSSLARGGQLKKLQDGIAAQVELQKNLAVLLKYVPVELEFLLLVPPE